MLAVVPFVTAIGVSAAAPTVTHHRTLGRETLPDKTCAALQQHVGCYAEETETDTEASSNILVSTADAWNGCSQIFSYTETWKSWTGLALAWSNMRFAVCWTSSDIQVTYGPHCAQSSIIGYGAGNDYCDGNTTYATYPAFADDSWYIYLSFAPWSHQTAFQEVLIYWTYQNWHQCYPC
ncbi:MAG: hypothetical protein WB682_07545 [Candidatus Dormiibacterota bacterium]